MIANVYNFRQTGVPMMKMKLTSSNGKTIGMIATPKMVSKIDLPCFVLKTEKVIVHESTRARLSQLNSVNDDVTCFFLLFITLYIPRIHETIAGRARKSRKVITGSCNIHSM